jgi:hypothetical protein
MEPPENFGDGGIIDLRHPYLRQGRRDGRPRRVDCEDSGSPGVLHEGAPLT